jgi:hypothetical protein
MSAPTRGTAATELEMLLHDMEGLAMVLLTLGASENEDGCYSYLGGRLRDHATLAQDAFCRIFGLNEYAAERGGPGPDTERPRSP